jgi:hypothetical protein
MKSISAFGILALLALPVHSAGAELVIAKDGHSDYRIVVPDGKSSAVAYAAGELQRFLQDMLWYMQLGWPDRFGLSKGQGRELLARFKNVVQAFSIINESEGPIGNMSRFLADRDARYGK